MTIKYLTTNENDDMKIVRLSLTEEPNGDIVLRANNSGILAITTRGTIQRYTLGDFDVNNGFQRDEPEKRIKIENCKN